jgi:hypothetical protein
MLTFTNKVSGITYLSIPGNTEYELSQTDNGVLLKYSNKYALLGIGIKVSDILVQNE